MSLLRCRGDAIRRRRGVRLLVASQLIARRQAGTGEQKLKDDRCERPWYLASTAKKCEKCETSQDKVVSERPVLNIA